jgi:predicted HicB family RNase H-like nuclease
MELRIRNLDDKTHEAAKVASQRSKKSLNQYVIEAVRGAVLRSAQKDKAVAAVLETK